MLIALAIICPLAFATALYAIVWGVLGAVERLPRVMAAYREAVR